ncbi:MAG: DUF3106 domain-containing protein [Ferrovum sp.]|jgi:hypothetical protein|nr:DUF3106 domain-containing protein [Ferrovum sp.]NDU90903.1 DUF3106 domain-containing protein [Ferrovum sp.]
MASGKALIAVCLLLLWNTACAQGMVPAPAWSSLTSQQKIILAPAAQDWDHLSSLQRKRLLSAAQHYPKLSPAEQARFQKNIPIWTHLSKATRDQARHNYKVFHALPPEKRAAIKSRWRAHHSSVTASGAPVLTQTAPVSGSQTPPVPATVGGESPPSGALPGNSVTAGKTH